MSGTAPHRPVLTAAHVARGLGALVVLTVLVIGMPVALWLADGSPVPATMPGVDDVRALLTAPDDGSFFLDVLILAGWFGWATFAFSVLVEIPAVARGVRAPALPGLAAQQRVVAALVAAIAAMLPATQIAAADVARPSVIAEPSPWSPAPPVTSDSLDRNQHPSGPRDGRAHPAPNAHRTTRYTHEVVAGDTLWDIAATRLGDPRRYPEIFAASTSTIQPDGHRLSDPDVIRPGWVLTIPRDDTNAGAAIPETATPETTPPEAALPETGAADGAAPGEVDALTDCLAPGDSATHAHAGDTGVGASAADSTEFGGLLRTGGGVGAALAAGVVGVLTTRRALSQRRRRAGQRLAGSSAVDRATETELRRTGDQSGVELVDNALRTLLAATSGAGQDLPAVVAVRLTPTTLELYLESADHLPDPFTDFGRGRVWGVSRRAVGLLTTQSARQYPAPYPSLVSIGHDTDDALLMIDLERLGTISLDGPPVITAAMTAAIAAELATSPWADDLRVTFLGGPAWAELEALETGRVRHATDAERLLGELSVRAADDRGMLRAAGAAGVVEARSRQLAEPAWTPEIILVPEPLDPERQARLAALIDNEPRVAVAAVLGEGDSGTRRESADAGPGWRLRVVNAEPDVAVVLDPLGMRLRPQLLDADTCDRILNLVRRSTDVVGDAQPEPDLRSLPPLPTTPDSGLRGTGTHRVDVHNPEAPRAQAAGDENPPRLIMLGQVEVIHTAELGERNKLGQLTELALFIALHPGCDTDALDSAIWPGSAVTRTTRNTAVSKLRRWLGTDAHGAPLLPRTEGRYAFLAQVRSDWDDWRDLLPNGPKAATTANLRDALALVRGRPFSGRGRRSYAWADHHAQEMISAVVDVCHELAARASMQGDHREARRTALFGLSIEPGVELLWRDRLRAEVMLGDRDTVLQSIETLRSTADELGGDLETDTEDLIDQITGRIRRQGSRGATTTST